MLILGLHSEWHSSGAAALLDDGYEIKIVAISQERLDRIKDSPFYPDDAIDYCLKALGAESIEQCDLIVSDYIYSPIWENDRRPGFNSSLSLIKKKIIGKELRPSIPKNKVVFVNHHLAHACSAFYGSGYNNSAVLVVDGHGSLVNGKSSKARFSKDGCFETQSLYEANGNRIDQIETSTKTGIGMLYHAFTMFLGFKHLQEGKTMGLAPHGERYKEKYIRFPHTFDGIETNYYDLVNIWDKNKRWIKQNDLIQCKDRSKQTNPYYSKIAWEVQEETEKAMLHLARYARKRTQKTSLCLAGGVALNSVANFKILNSDIFDQMWVQPASSDTGIPLGCVLHGYYHLMGGKKKWSMKHAYMGREYSQYEIENDVEKYSKELKHVENLNCQKVARLLVNGKIVGWFQGASEYGPRALGHRSIIVDPRRIESKDFLNMRVKHREPFRPFAPAVLCERTADYFMLNIPSPFMLFVPPAHKSKKDEIPAVVHVDETARVQTVTKDENGLYYELIKAFENITGIPVVLNTSFNVAGEPIVETPEDAIRCFLKTEIDVLVIGHLLLRK